MRLPSLTSSFSQIGKFALLGLVMLGLEGCTAKDYYLYAKDFFDTEIPGAMEIEKNHQAPWSHHVDLKKLQGKIYDLTGKGLDFNIDSPSFIILNGKYAKDKNQVYILSERREGYKIFHELTHILTGTDAASFEIMDAPMHRYAHDKNRIYFNQEPIQGSDSLSFQVLGKYAKDKNQVYFLGRDSSDSPIILNNADVKTFALVKIEQPTGADPAYAKDANAVYVDGAPSSFDPQGFIKLSQFYSKSKRYVYFEDEVMDGADPGTFQEMYYLYSRDKNHAFYRSKMISGADPDTLEKMCIKHTFIIGGTPIDQDCSLKSDDYVTDKNYVYFQGELIEDIDPESAVLLGDFIKDENGVFKYGSNKKIETFDAGTFHLISYTGQKMGGAITTYGDVRSYKNADIGSFEPLGWGYARDKYYGYYAAKAIDDSDGSTFEYLGDSYARDKNYGYFLGKKIPGSDGATFEYTNDVRAQDKYHLYYDGYVIQDRSPQPSSAH